jgi:hypothetical protein
VRSDHDGSMLAPVIITLEEQANIFTVLERHFQPFFLPSCDKFWRDVRNALNVETWRPRAYGEQLRALTCTRLPLHEEEFQAIARAAATLQDCLVPASSLQALMFDLRTTVKGVTAWWESRLKKPDGAARGPGCLRVRGWRRHACGVVCRARRGVQSGRRRTMARVLNEAACSATRCVLQAPTSGAPRWGHSLPSTTRSGGSWVSSRGVTGKAHGGSTASVHCTPATRRSGTHQRGRRVC